MKNVYTKKYHPSLRRDWCILFSIFYNARLSSDSRKEIFQATLMFSEQRLKINEKYNSNRKVRMKLEIKRKCRKEENMIGG